MRGIAMAIIWIGLLQMRATSGHDMTRADWIFTGILGAITLLVIAAGW